MRHTAETHKSRPGRFITFPLGRLVIALLLLACSANAATVTNNLIDVFGVSSSPKVTFTPQLTPLAEGGSIILDQEREVKPTNGLLSVTLKGGRYKVSLGPIGRPVYIDVPADTNTYSLISLATNLPVFLHTNDMNAISKRVLKGTGPLTFTTNNAGLPTETITVSSTAIATNGTAGGDLTGTYPSPTLVATGTAGTYTKVTTDSKGRVTSGTTLVAGDIPALPAYIASSGGRGTNNIFTNTFDVSFTNGASVYGGTNAGLDIGGLFLNAGGGVLQWVIDSDEGALLPNEDDGAKIGRADLRINNAYFTDLTVNGSSLVTQLAGKVAASTLTTKGDIFVRNASAITRLSVGTDGQVLTADSTQSTGTKWAAVSGGGGNFNPSQFDTNGSSQVSIASGATVSNLTHIGTLTATNINGVKVYRALLNQSGTSAPGAVVLENTLGGTPAYSRVAQGSYNITLSSAFTANKTLCFLNPGVNSTAGFGHIERVDANILNITTQDNTFGAADDILVNASVEILVYP